jgi:hypothetical protein
MRTNNVGFGRRTGRALPRGICKCAIESKDVSVMISNTSGLILSFKNNEWNGNEMTDVGRGR